MNAAPGVPDVQADALLRRIADERAARLAELRERAAREALEIESNARRDARLRAHDAASAERRRVELALADRRAALETVARRTAQAALRECVTQAWARLPAALAARWGDPHDRAAWCEAACDCASRALLPGSCVVVEVDRADADPLVVDLRSMLRARGFDDAEVRPVGNIGAGLRLLSGGACVDATARGLLAPRERIEAELLAEVERAAGGPAAIAP